MRLLVVVMEDRLPMDEGETDLGVEKSEPEDELLEAIGKSRQERKSRR